MEPNKILKADILDLIFEGRNKEYGAYELRKNFNKRMWTALGITAGLFILIAGGTILANELKSAPKEFKQQEVVLQEIAQEEEKKPEPPPPPPPKPVEPPKVEMAKFTPPVIKKDEEVKQEEIPPVDDLDEKKIDIINQEGIKDENIATPPPDEGKQIIETPKEEPEDKIFEKVEIEATVDPRAWKRHLESQLQRYIEDAASQGMNPGQYTVQVRFLVERDGSITDVRALNDPGYGLGKAAADVLRKGPKWSPGEQNGRKVRSYHTQPITFVIAEE
jgi:periplasmic protein TonB